MNLLPVFCSDCRMYMGVQDGHGEIPQTFLMPHLPGCRIGDPKREALEREAELEAEVLRLAQTEQALLGRLSRLEREAREAVPGG